MSNQKQKKPNAYKHGVFSATPIIPGEDPREFAKLHLELMLEWHPDGATEEDAVFSIAKAIWRKHRVQRFLEFQLLRHSLNSAHEAYDDDEARVLLGLAVSLAAKPESALQDLSHGLRRERIAYFAQKFPRGNFKSATEWAQAVMADIATLLFPKLKTDDSEAGRLVELVESSTNLSGDLFKQELALDERLDLMIDRAVKRLVQTKAMKQMLRATGPGQSAGQPRKLERVVRAN